MINFNLTDLVSAYKNTILNKLLQPKQTSYEEMLPADPEPQPAPAATVMPDDTQFRASASPMSAIGVAIGKAMQNQNNLKAFNERRTMQDMDAKVAAWREIEAKRKEAAQRLANEKDYTQFKEGLDSTKADTEYKKAHTDLTRAQLASVNTRTQRMAVGGNSGGSRSAAPTSDNVVLDDAAYQELANSGVDIKNLSDKDLKRIYFAMNRKSATGAAPKDTDKEAAIREKVVRIQNNIERRKEFNPTAGPTEDEAALLDHYKGQLGAAPVSATPVKGNSIDDQTAAFLAKKQQAAPVTAPTVAPAAPTTTNNIVEFKGEDGRTYKIDKITGKIYVK